MKTYRCACLLTEYHYIAYLICGKRSALATFTGLAKFTGVISRESPACDCSSITNELS